jgi:hypothetical protein
VPDPTAQLSDIRAHVEYYSSAGMHPIRLVGKQPVDKGWQASAEPPQATEFQVGHNVGLRMGPQASGVTLVCVDVDGVAEDLLRIAEDWPDTLAQSSSPGKFHLFYVWPADLQIPRNGVKLHGKDGQKTCVDIRSTGGQVVVQPSIHPTTGSKYEWICDQPPATIPLDTARAILTSQRGGRSEPAAKREYISLPDTSTSLDRPATPAPLTGQSPTVDELGETYDISTLKFLGTCRKLAKRDLPVSAAFELLAHGCAFAEPGHRDDTIWRMCYYLAKELPNARPENIEAHFAQSVSAMRAISPFKAEPDIAAKFARARKQQREEYIGVQFILSAQGSPVAAPENILRAWRQDPDLVGRLGYDEFSGRLRVLRQLPWDVGQTYPRDWHDRDATQISAYMHNAHRLNVKAGQHFECAVVIAHENSYHPVRDYLAAAASTWDGQPRIDTWLQRFVGAPDTEYTRKVSAWTLIQACKRIFKPGCQADYVLILESPQGRRKTTSIAALASPEWFAGNVSAFASKDAMADIQGKWIVELSELTGIRAEINATKAFLSRMSDRFRPSYGRIAEDFQRQCVFIGSTNDREYLTDPTGARRYWPIAVEVDQIDREALVAERDQLWGEAAARCLAGERCYPEFADFPLFDAMTAPRRVRDSWESVIEDWSTNPMKYKGDPECLTSAWILHNVLDQTTGGRGDETRLATCLRACGWERAAGGRVWIPPQPLKLPAGQVNAPVLRLAK